MIPVVVGSNPIAHPNPVQRETLHLRFIANSVDLRQGAPLVGRDVIGPVAVDLVLRVVLRRAPPVALVVEVRAMDPDDRAAHATGLRIPADVVADRIFRQS